MPNIVHGKMRSLYLKECSGFREIAISSQGFLSLIQLNLCEILFFILKFINFKTSNK